jgi:hypothetical protein
MKNFALMVLFLFSGGFPAEPDGESRDIRRQVQGGYRGFLNGYQGVEMDGW